MRIVFMGTPEFAAQPLHTLIKAGHEIAAVYTQPPRPSGRGHKIQKSPVHLLAEQHDIGVRTPLNFKNEDERQKLRDLNAEIGVVAAYGLILPQAVLDAPARGCLNIHASLLPRWRGAAPIHRVLLAGDTETGITIMRMEAGLDTGPMLLTEKTPIVPDDTTQSVHDRLAQMGADMIVKTLQQIDALASAAQPETGVTYAHKIIKDEGILKGGESADQVDRMVRALTPWPGVWLTLEGVRFKILQGYALHGISLEGTFNAFGTLHNKDGDVLCADTGTGASLYRITKLQTPSGKTMSVADAVNGGLIQCA